MATNLFFQLADNLRPACQQIVGNTVIEGAQAVKAGAPVDTEFMQDAVYYVTPDGRSTYGQASPEKKGSYLLDEVTPENDLQGVIGAAANYSVFVDQGHHTSSGSWVPPQPFFSQGVEQLETIFNEQAADFEALIGA